jgi:hypothetical protein
MMELFSWLQQSALADTIRDSRWMYPAIETGHYLGLSLLVGGIMLIDLRVLGFARTLPLRAMIGILPIVWVGFIINVTTGTLLFIYGASRFAANPAFQLKMAFVLLAGVNALLFDLAVRRSKVDWVAIDRPPAYVKTFATLSFALWLCVVTTGRWMAYL